MMNTVSIDLSYAIHANRQLVQLPRYFESSTQKFTGPLWFVLYVSQFLE